VGIGWEGKEGGLGLGLVRALANYFVPDEISSSSTPVLIGPKIAFQKFVAPFA
jgi:hypothetical protein